MKIVVAPDSFKESLSAKQVAGSITLGILKVFPDAEIVQIPVSDGGEGLLDAFSEAMEVQKISMVVRDPLLRDIDAHYGVLDDKTTAVIEMANASGLELLEENEKDPVVTSSYGTGQLILNALDRGYSKLIIGLGGSATNDGGMGMVRALGVRFLDENNEEIGEGGGVLDRLRKIDISGLDDRLVKCKITGACDVTNPLTGPNGASFVYGSQKGGTPDALKQLDENMMHYASIIQSDIGVEANTVEGAGAAGGMGAALVAFFGAKLRSGFDLISESLELEYHIRNANLVITGEGKIDKQTLNGKVVSGVAGIAKKCNVPVIVIAGKIGEGIDQIYNHGVTAVFSIVDQPMELAAALKNADGLIQSCVENIMRVLKI